MCNGIDLRQEIFLLFIQSSCGGRSIEAPTGIVAEVEGRLPEQLESNITRMKEYPKEMDQSSVERIAKTIPTQLGKARRATIDELQVW